MSKKIKFLTGCLSAAEHLRVDAEEGKLLIYSVPSFPPGIIDPAYLDQCSSVAVAITSSGNLDYLVAMPIRPDKQRSGSMKDLDIDPVIFCFKRDDLEPFPTGVALSHQRELRNTHLPGYEAFTVEQTVVDLRSKLTTGYQPLSGSPQYYFKTISHSVAKLDQLVGSNVQHWLSASHYTSSLPGGCNSGNADPNVPVAGSKAP